jgi:hypothetical protein
MWSAPVLAAIAASFLAFPEERFFAGALGGIATLSADARFDVPERSAASGYKPENGSCFSPVAGYHATDFVTFQVSYIWNRNNVRYHAVSDVSFHDQPARTSHQAGIADAMLYFRRRDQWARPYLAAGTGLAWLSSEASPAQGSLTPAPGNFSEFSPILNVAVGIDLRLRRGWAFRFTFSETIQRNAMSKRLTPPAARNLAEFRNLFGFVKHF